MGLLAAKAKACKSIMPLYDLYATLQATQSLKEDYGLASNDTTGSLLRFEATGSATSATSVGYNCCVAPWEVPSSRPSIAPRGTGNSQADCATRPQGGLAP